MAQNHNAEYTEAPMTTFGTEQAPNKRYRRLRNPSFNADVWTDKNPLLQKGELGIETDTSKVKIGDGVAYWNDLPYMFDDAGANTDLSNLSDTGKANISAEGTYDPNETYDAGTVGAAIQSKADATTSANTDLSNLTSTGKNIANWASIVTNCIAEIPQDLKVELNNGTLTLKAGSKVYVPNGAGVFNEEVLTVDKTITPSTFATSSNRMIIYRYGSIFMLTTTLPYVYSGDTAPTTFDSNGRAFWYDTANNNIKYTDNSGSTWTSDYAFPIALVSITNGIGVTDINQLFNGFGYIGSTIYALPGVKGLAPNGRNADGTLKTTTIASSSVVTRTFTDSANGQIAFYGSVFGQGGYHLADDGYLYNDANALIAGACVIGQLKRTSGHIDYFYLRPLLQVVNYGDTEFIAHQAMPGSRYSELTLGTSGSTYTAIADGYLTLNKSATAAGQYINFVKNVNGMNCNAIAPSALPLSLYMPVSKGDVITINYDAAGTTSWFRFIYTNGAK